MNVSYDEVQMLSELTRAYLRGDESTRNWYAYSSNEANILSVIEQRKNQDPVNREALVATLSSQYSEIDSKNVNANIKALANSNTYTITTGHQLNLFTGPLYFIYKIVSAIKTAKQLNKTYPNYHFVPVYWMATEDHDFEEINHAFIDGKKIEWNNPQKGMVGEFSTNEMQAVVDEFCYSLGSSVRSSEISKQIKEAYSNHSNLADATRFLVHTLFEKYGLVIIDANHTDLKRSFSEVLKKELLEQTSFEKVTETITQFKNEYKAQVSPREINLFYVKPGLRERIQLTEKGFEVNNTEINFSRNQMLEELNNYPERFSPNVILRPVYQECILPNVMYIGGGAEVAYWLELKSTFDAFSIPYPLLQIRSSFLYLADKSYKKMECLGLSELDLYQKKEYIITRKTNDLNPYKETLKSTNDNLQTALNSLAKELEAYEHTLLTSVDVSKKSAEKLMTRLQKKVTGAVKRKQKQELDQINSLFSDVYPNGVYQERQVNFFEMNLQYGDSFLDSIFELTEPFTDSFLVFNHQGKA